MANLIYHYCNCNTFTEIIKNKTIRLSDLNKTNDYMEKKWARQFMVKALENQLEKMNIEFDLREDCWYNDKSKTHLDYYNSYLDEIFKEEEPILIACSKTGDLLSQWRAYADDGCGISIGFERKYLEKLEKEDNIYVEDILYQELDSIYMIELEILESIQYIKDLKAVDVLNGHLELNEYFREEFDAFCEVFGEKISIVASLIKNNAFIEEQEVRILYNPYMPFLENILFDEAQIYFKRQKTINKFRLKPMNFNCRNNQSVAFCDIDFKEYITKGIIKEIIIGPKSSLKEMDINYFLLANGIDIEDIEIKKSQATYR